MKKTASFLATIFIAFVFAIALPACPDVKIEGDTITINDLGNRCEQVIFYIEISQTIGAMTSQESFGEQVKDGKVEKKGFNTTGALKLDQPLTITVTLRGIVPEGCPLSKDKTYTFTGTLKKEGDKKYSLSLSKFTVR
jgi:hypothetical protein